MTETTVRHFIISALIFGAIIAGAFSLISFSIPNKPESFTLTNSTLNKFETIKTNANAMKDKFPTAQPESGTLGILNGLIQVSWGALKSVWNTFDIMTGVISDLSEGSIGIAIPSWFTGMLIAIIGIVIAFALMAAWFQWNI